MVLCYVTYAVPPNSLMKGVFVNGAQVSIEDNKVKLFNGDNLMIILAPLPKKHHYNIVSEGISTQYAPDSLHLVYTFHKINAYSIDIQVQPELSVSKNEKLHISVNNRFLTSWKFLPLLSLYLLLLMGAALYAIVLLNFRNKEKVQNLRNEWTSQLHNDIGGDLSSVSMRLEILRKKLTEELDPKIYENLKKIFIILNDIQKKLRFVFNLVDPKKDTFQVMLLGLYDYAYENCLMQGSELVYKNEISPDEKLNIEVSRINKLYLLMKEVLNNTFKYARATTVSILIQQRNEGIWIELKDNGIGFDPDAPHSGNGLKNLIQMARDGFMDISINSKPGEGTCVTILVFLKFKTTSSGGKSI